MFVKLAQWTITWFSIYTGCLFMSYFMKCKEPRLYANRLVSLFHAIYVSVMGYAISFGIEQLGYFTFPSPFDENQPYHDSLLTALSGYMIFDLVYILWLGSEEKEFKREYLLHHITSIFVCMSSVYYGYYANITTLIIYITESTTPLLALRTFAKYHGFEHWKLVKISNFYFAIRFIYNRMIWMNLCHFTIIFMKPLPLFYWIGMISMNLVNFYWSKVLLEMMVRTVTGKEKLK